MSNIHKYNLKGELVEPWEDGYFSVTTILDVRHKAKLWDWKMRVGWDEAQNKMLDAQEKGKRVHEIIEGLIKGPANATTDTLAQGFLNWWWVAKPVGSLSERFVVSKRHGFAGTADLICDVDRSTWIIDFKTGSKSIDHGLQLAAYRQAWKEMTGTTARTACLYLTDKTKKGYQFVEYNEPVGPFLAAKKLFDWQVKKEPFKKPTQEYIGGMLHVEDAN